MNEPISKIDRADAIRLVMELRERAYALLELLLPDDVEGGCPHPRDAIRDESTMGDELYRCSACGETSTTPFPSIINKD